MHRYQVTASDRQTARELRIELDARSDAEAIQIVTRFANVRAVDLAEPPRHAAASHSPPHATASYPGSPAIAAGNRSIAGPATTIGTVQTFSAERPDGKRSAAHLVVGGLIAVLAIAVLMFGFHLAGQPEPDASTGKTLMLTAGIMLAVGLGWVLVASLFGGKSTR